MDNKVEIISKSSIAGPYDVRINGVSLPDVLEIDLNNVMNNDGRYITVSFFVKEVVVKKED